MITYTKVFWKNFLQTGNDGFEVNLNADRITLIKGLNGSGKSTILDAICFALYGKPFRKVTKPLLINTINEKGTLVWIEFETQGHKYRIERGIKPNKLEFFCDGQLVEQSAEVKDYQEEIDKILKCSHKTFTQVDILGSAKYTPFMELKTPERREVVENLLDVAVFTEMAKIGKAEKDMLSKGLDVLRSKISEKQLHLRLIGDKLKKENTDNLGRIAEIDAQISELSKSVEKYQQEQQVIFTEATEKREVLHPVQPFRERLNHLKVEDGKILQEGQSSAALRKFLKENDVCPTCRQTINDGHVHIMVSDLENVMKTAIASRELIMKQMKDLEVDILSNSQIESEILTLKNQYSNLATRIGDAEIQIKGLEGLRSSLAGAKKEESSKIEYDEVASALEELEEELAVAERDMDDTLFAMSMLKDDGIKATVIEEYIPLFNKLINEYLDKMNFFCQFTLNNQFDETINSRYRDQFKYDSFSEGQKMRINLAILFAWREVTKHKNSVSSNLLILDEVLDGSLDYVGKEDFIKIIKQFTDGTNTFIISHSLDGGDGFDTVIDVKTVDNFSRYAIG